jgi:hypothetical protein
MFRTIQATEKRRTGKNTVFQYAATLVVPFFENRTETAEVKNNLFFSSKNPICVYPYLHLRFCEHYYNAGWIFGHCYKCPKWTWPKKVCSKNTKIDHTSLVF